MTAPRAAPRIVATCLAGAGTDAIIADALRSVAPFVDAIIVIDTWGNGAATTPREAIGQSVHRCLYLASWPWQDDFAAARNAAIDAARDVGADWAFTIDTDERIDTRGDDVRAVLASTPGDVLLSRSDDGTYSKPRAIRTACASRWIGRAHESITASAPERLHTFPSLVFSELPKTPAEYAAKFARDERLLRRDLAETPGDARIHYYLGATLHGLGRLDEAIDSFRVCAELRGWYEESAFACVRAAELLCELDRYGEAIGACCAGLARDAGMAELAVIAGHASLMIWQTEQARCWARIAAVHSEDAATLSRRIGFRRPDLLAGGAGRILEAVASGWKPPTLQVEALGPALACIGHDEREASKGAVRPAAEAMARAREVSTDIGGGR